MYMVQLVQGRMATNKRSLPVASFTLYKIKMVYHALMSCTLFLVLYLKEWMWWTIS